MLNKIPEINPSIGRINAILQNPQILIDSDLDEEVIYNFCDFYRDHIEIKDNVVKDVLNDLINKHIYDISNNLENYIFQSDNVGDLKKIKETVEVLRNTLTTFNLERNTGRTKLSNGKIIGALAHNFVLNTENSNKSFRRLSSIYDYPLIGDSAKLYDELIQALFNRKDGSKFARSILRRSQIIEAFIDRGKVNRTKSNDNVIPYIFNKIHTDIEAITAYNSILLKNHGIENSTVDPDLLFELLIENKRRIENIKKNRKNRSDKNLLQNLEDEIRTLTSHISTALNDISIQKEADNIFLLTYSQENREDEYSDDYTTTPVRSHEKSLKRLYIDRRQAGKYNKAILSDILSSDFNENKRINKSILGSTILSIGSNIRIYLNSKRVKLTHRYHLIYSTLESHWKDRLYGLLIYNFINHDKEVIKLVEDLARSFTKSDENEKDISSIIKLNEAKIIFYIVNTKMSFTVKNNHVRITAKHSKIFDNTEASERMLTLLSDKVKHRIAALTISVNEFNRGVKANLTYDDYCLLKMFECDLAGRNKESELINFNKIERENLEEDLEHAELSIVRNLQFLISDILPQPQAYSLTTLVNTPEIELIHNIFDSLYCENSKEKMNAYVKKYRAARGYIENDNKEEKIGNDNCSQKKRDEEKESKEIEAKDDILSDNTDTGNNISSEIKSHKDRFKTWLNVRIITLLATIVIVGSLPVVLFILGSAAAFTVALFSLTFTVGVLIPGLIILVKRDKKISRIDAVQQKRNSNINQIESEIEEIFSDRGKTVFVSPRDSKTNCEIINVPVILDGNDYGVYGNSEQGNIQKSNTDKQQQIYESNSIR